MSEGCIQGNDEGQDEGSRVSVFYSLPFPLIQLEWAADRNGIMGCVGSHFESTPIYNIPCFRERCNAKYSRIRYVEFDNRSWINSDVNGAFVKPVQRTSQLYVSVNVRVHTRSYCYLRENPRV